MDGLSLSPLALFQSAGPVGRGVMIVLALASVWCWVVIAEAIFSIARLGRARRRRDAPNSLFSVVFEAGRAAAALRLPGEGVGERRHRLAEAMTREARGLLHRAEGRLTDLAVIASVAPFIGLFGTVWGIMASFTGIAAAQDTSLAVVAPGIAEALAATAWGLAAAIPASIGYSRLGTAFGALAVDVSDLIEVAAVDLVAAEEARTP
ncbi:MAG: MotA/TolQ/ExbB proton channel family protein [Hyphomicrobiales bacterium]|nr:MotA/TolQ/ExbB proton channel family protein [Hyphomicrobiales bacterium]